jgi:uncharacterized membrane protein YkoI
MKTKTLMVVALAAAWTFFAQASAAEKELGKRQVPKPVLEAFEKAYPNAKGVEYEQELFEGQPAYEVEYKENGKEYESLYRADGTLLQQEEAIDAKALPDPVIQAVAKAHPKAKIKEAEKLMKPDGTLIGYEVEIVEEGRKYEIKLDVGGQILNTERD